MILDRLCQVANFEREYIQLHRDSTVGQITLQPSLVDGKIVWKDSPLLRAVRDGLTLVVDEADKAPTEVLSVLKGLVEDGELLLPDGRRISRRIEPSSSNSSKDIIPMHPNSPRG
jgi:MoxR-like ATPase